MGLRIALVAAYDDRCYGLRCIASYLRQKGHEVWLLCFKRFDSRLVARENEQEWRRVTSTSYPPVTEAHEEGTVFCPYLHPATEREWELLLEKLAAIRPDLIGVTLTTATLDPCRAMTDRIHRDLPGVPVVWGGIHPTILAEECLQTADMVCLGEGEEAMVELCADTQRTDIAGLWRRQGGETIRNPIRPLEQDLDRFPFASFGENEWLIEDNQIIGLPATNKTYFRGVYTIMTQRGCPFSCTYCLHHVTREMHKGERYVRRRSVDHVLAECVQRARDFDLPGFGFFDDIFVMDRKWIAEFAEKYPKRVGLPFGGYAYPTVSTDEMLAQLARAGMIFIGMGIQTGSDYISREIYGRRYGGEDLLALAQAAAKCGLALNYELLTNTPYESETDCLETLRLLTRLPKPLTLCVKRLVVFPGLCIAALDKPRHNLPESTFEFYNQLYLIARHHLIPADQLLVLAEDAYLKANSEILRSIALGLKRMVETESASRNELERLLAEERQVTWRGFFRYAKDVAARRLPAPIRKMFSRQRRAPSR